MRPDTQDDVASSASSIPLPSSPIAIPTPAPKLKLDFGTPELLSPFVGMTETALAEIKVLQDPRNITTGCPSSGPVVWPLESKRSCPLPRESVVSGTLSASSERKHSVVKLEHFRAGLTPETEDPFSQKLCHITVPGLSLQSESNAMNHISPERGIPNVIGRLECASTHMDGDPSPKSSKPHGVYDEAPFALKVRNPDSIEDFAGVSMRAMSDVGTTPAQSVVAQADRFTAPREKHASPVELLVIPPPLFGLETRSSENISNTDDASQGKKQDIDADTPELHLKCSQQPSIAPSVSSSASLIAHAVQKSREDTSIEGPVTAGRGRKASCSVMAQQASASSEDDDDNDDGLVQVKAWSPLSARENQDPWEIKGSEYLRKDSVFEDLNEEAIPQSGPPSPTRKVKLPLRPKNDLVSRTSYESMVFKPTLNRAAAKQLGVFRPGSDPTLRQRYFPHLPVSPSTLAKHARQFSLDSDDGGTPVTQKSTQDSDIFERAVETPSPLQIRKQSGFTVTHFSSPPGTPREGPDAAHAPNSSSPTRTPSMGDRQVFDLQRAKRNARYNAIHSGDAKVDGDSDLQLADFGNAGPGSRGSSPKRNDSEEAIDMKKAELLLEQALAALPAAQADPMARSAKGRVMFTLSRD